MNYIGKRVRQFVCLLSAAYAVSVEGEIPPCYRELETGIFQTSYVGQALANQRVPQGAWGQIQRMLSAKIRDIPTMIESEARRMNPNPFEPTFEPKLAKELLEKVQKRVLANVLAQFNFNNKPNIQQIYNYLKERNKARFIACFGEEEPPKQKSSDRQ